jgi:hypothetical protein
MPNKLISHQEFVDTVIGPAVVRVYGDPLVLAAVRAAAEFVRDTPVKRYDKSFDECFLTEDERKA